MRKPGWLPLLALASALWSGCNGSSPPPSSPPEQPSPPEPQATPAERGSTEEPTATRPATDAPPGHYRELASFMSRTCGLRDNGEIQCWSTMDGRSFRGAPGVYEHLGREGANWCGLRADGSVGCPPEAPVPPGGQSSNMGVPPGGPFRAITGANSFRCGLDQAGAIHCRGTNALLTPTPPDGRFAAIVADDAFVCGLTDAGTVRCSTADGPEAQLAGGPYASIAAGGGAVCGLRRSDGGVTCSRPAPGGETETTGFSQIAMGMSHRCGLKEGHVQCWGVIIDPSHFPPADEVARHVAVGVQTCILREDGTVGCWDTQRATERMP